MSVEFYRAGRAVGWIATPPHRRPFQGSTMAAGRDLPHDLVQFTIERALDIRRATFAARRRTCRHSTPDTSAPRSPIRTMTQHDIALPATNAAGSARVAGRAAQFLLGIPLGLFQLAAVLGFTFTGAVVTRGDWFVAIWGMLMSASCAVLALRVYRSASARRVAFALLAAQGIFTSVKFFLYHESAGLVFAAITAVTLATLTMYHRAVSA